MLTIHSKNLIKSCCLKLTPIKEKPWGATIGIQSESYEKFLSLFFKETAVMIDNISPRFLVVNPKSRLSWQMHRKRRELWRVIKGPVGVMLSNTNEQPKKYQIKNKGSLVEIKQEQRHRLIGLKKQGVVAEIWIHTNMGDPSGAEDIVRIEDDYKRGF